MNLIEQNREHARLQKEHSLLAWCLSQIVSSLPTKRDWLDPDVERESREILAHLEVLKTSLDTSPEGTFLLDAAVERFIALIDARNTTENHR